MNSLKKFEFKVLASFIAAVLVIVGLVANTWRVERIARQSVQLVAQSQELIAAIARTASETLQIEFSTQNFRLSGNPERLAERDVAIANREFLLGQIKSLTADNLLQHARWTELRDVVNARLAISRHIEEIRKTDGQEAATAFANSAPLQATRDQINGLLREMEGEESKLLAVRLYESQRAQLLMVYSGSLAGALLLSLIGATFVLIRRQIRQTEVSRIEAIASERSLSATFLSIGEGVIATDERARISRMNPIAEHLTGWTLNKAIGQPVEVVFHTINEHTRERAPMPVAEVIAAGQIRPNASHTLLIARDGNEIHITDCAAPIRDATGHLTGVVLVFRDVTAEHNAHKIIREQNETLEQRVAQRTSQLKESEERYKTLFRTSPDALALTRFSDGCYLDVNDGFERLFGWERESIIGKTSKDIGIWRSWEERPKLFKAIEGSSRCEGLEAELVKRNGEIATALISAQIVVLGDQKCVLSVTHDVTERQALLRTLSDNEKFISSVVNSLSEHVAALDATGKIISVNEAWIRFARENGDSDLSHTGIGVNYLDVCDRANQANDDHSVTDAIHGIRAVLAGEKMGFAMEYPCHSPTQQRWFELHVVPLLGTSGGAVLFHQDITSRRGAEDLIRESEQHFRTLANGGSLLIWTSGLDKLCNYFNEPWLHFTGRSLEQEGGEGWMLGVHPDDVDRRNQVYIKAFEQREPFSMDYRLRHADGEYRWIRDDGNPRSDSQGVFLGYIGFCMDITERKASAEQIEHLAFYDLLTELPNRRLMFDRLGQALNNSARRHRHGAVLMIDLDNFKSLNDTLGHPVGDQLLIEVALRLQACIRAGDTVARLGGDEFVAILEDLDEGEQAAISAEYVGDKILAYLSAPYVLDVPQQAGKSVHVTHRCTSSIGIALFRESGVTAEELIKRADTAMYQAKAAGRNAKRFYDPKMQAAVTHRAKLESDLRRAIEQQEFLLHYQAQVDSDDQTVGAEALIRWQHPDEGLVSPITFIPIAEETGLIIPIGKWVLESACKQLASWAENPTTAKLTLAINVSANQFRLTNFVEQVLTIIKLTGANPDLIKLELTESLLLENAEDIISKMNALRDAGVKFSLDDFGTGYSSLAYLKRLPLDQLKIDKSFVSDVLSDANDAAIARTIVTLAQSLGIAVIAEGVETRGQRDFLAHAGCRFYQGYFYSRPLPILDFEGFIESIVESSVQA
jgi:diguanylate cyclase (GGDEF)-like protein/PAS domain S-box-containing protein